MSKISSYTIERLTRFALAESRFRLQLTSCQNRCDIYFPEVRKAMGLNQRQMAERLGVTHVWLCKVEKDRERPGPEMLLKLAELALSEAADAKGTVSERAEQQEAGAI